MPSLVVILAAILSLLYAALRARIHFTQSEDEPPVVLASIPFLSPIIGLLRWRHKLWVHLMHQYKLPIYTLRLPMARVYIVSSPSLIPAIERQSKTIAFSPIEAEATVNLLAMSAATNRTLMRDPTGDNGHFTTFYHAVRPPLGPGPGLDAMNRRVAKSLVASLDSLRKRQSSTVSLFEWVQHEIIMATTDAEFGPGNPFRDPEFERAWHTFESRVPIMASNVFPRVLAPGALKAREFLASRFARYFQLGHHHRGSAFLHARHAHGVQRGLTLDDAARGELGVCMAILNNTVAAAYWMIYHLFSDPALLEDCRLELHGAVRPDEEDGTQTIDMNVVKHSCPVLWSTLQEVFRYRGNGTLLIRRVLKDHKLNGQHLLREGSIVLMPNSVSHFHPEIWGPDVNEFRHTRFLNTGGGGSSSSTRSTKAKRHSPNPPLRIFGGGSTLCPGRHFANTEILVFAALMVLQFDLRPTSADGRWAHVETDRSFGMGVARAFLMPENDFEVEIRLRISELNTRPCRVLLAESKGAVHTMAEDEDVHETVAPVREKET